MIFTSFSKQSPTFVVRKYKPVDNDGIIFSAQVAVPSIDFSKVKPNLHRNLPQPSICPVYGCSEDPKFYTERIQALGHKPEFNAPNGTPFGSIPGFETNMGIVPVPQVPIGGYIYAGGCGSNTTWQLYAEKVYV